MITNSKRTLPFSPEMQETPPSKKTKIEPNMFQIFNSPKSSNKQKDQTTPSTNIKNDPAPLAEKMRPKQLDDYIGQTHLIGSKSILHDLLKNGEVPSMILWGPPGCGKTSLVNVIMQESKKFSGQPVKFVKLSATNGSIKDVRDAVAEAENQSKQGRRTVVFMDEIHRFNKLQQDIFLPHVEAGTFILIGATTENPSSSLNSALLSRCRVFILKKLQKDELITIISKAVKSMDGEITLTNKRTKKTNQNITFFIEQEVIDWLAEVCDGDARVALGGLEIAVQAKTSNGNTRKKITLSIDDIKNSLKTSQNLLDKKTDIVHQLHNALHHSIRADDDNAALYWLARIMETGEDPVYIAKRLVRLASEEIRFDDENALSTAVHTMHACQMIGMPECDVLLAQCVIYLARAEKSHEIINALRKCQDIIENHKGPQPKVPLFIKDRSGEGKLRSVLGPSFKNLLRKENLNKCHLPEGLENIEFYDEDD